MDKKEAIKKMLDGRKVNNKEWDPEDYAYYDKKIGQFLKFFHSEDHTFELDINSAPDDEYEIHVGSFPTKSVYRELLKGTILIHPIYPDFLIKMHNATGWINIFHRLPGRVPVTTDDNVSELNLVIRKGEAVFKEYIGDDI